MIEGSIVTRKLLAHFLGVSESSVSKWIDQGMPCVDRGAKGKPSKLDVRECIAWWRDNVVMAEAKKPEKLFDRQMMVDIELKELKLRREKAEVVERESARWVIREMLTIMTSRLRQMARRYASQLVGVPDVPTAVDILTRIAEEIIRELRLPEAWQSIDDDIEAAAPAKDVA